MSISPQFGSHQTLPPASSLLPFNILNYSVPSTHTTAVDPRADNRAFSPNTTACRRQQQRPLTALSANSNTSNPSPTPGYQRPLISPARSACPAPAPQLYPLSPPRPRTCLAQQRAARDRQISLAWIGGLAGSPSPPNAVLNNPAGCQSGADWVGDLGIQQPNLARTSSTPGQVRTTPSFKTRGSNHPRAVAKSEVCSSSSEAPRYATGPHTSNQEQAYLPTTSTPLAGSNISTRSFFNTVISSPPAVSGVDTAGDLLLPQPSIAAPTAAATVIAMPRGTTAANSAAPRRSRKRDSGIAGFNEYSDAKKKRRSDPTAPHTTAGGTSRNHNASLESLFRDPSESEDDSDIIDLRNGILPDLVEEAKKKGEVIRLGQFQCAICMDFATGLTVTHCGHLFCGECLTTSLAITTQKNKCPLCRQKIENRPNTKNTKGYFPLELKVMTASRKGKKTNTASSRR